MSDAIPLIFPGGGAGPWGAGGRAAWAGRQLAAAGPRGWGQAQPKSKTWLIRDGRRAYRPYEGRRRLSKKGKLADRANKKEMGVGGRSRQGTYITSPAGNLLGRANRTIDLWVRALPGAVRARPRGPKPR